MAVAVDDVDLDRDRALVLRAQAGDDLAFASLYNRYQQRLIRFAARRVGNHADAEEIAQEAFARAYRALPDFGAERRFYSWLSVITARLCIDALRRGWRCEVGAIAEEPFIDTGFDRIERDDDVARIGAAMEQLNPRHREVLELREHEGWAYQRIADHYDVSLGTVEALLWRARKALRREYDALGSAVLAFPFIRRLFGAGIGESSSSMAALSALGTVAVLTFAGPATNAGASAPVSVLASPVTAHVASAHAAVAPPAPTPPTAAIVASTAKPATKSGDSATRSGGQTASHVLAPFTWMSPAQGQKAVNSKQIVIRVGGISLIGVSPSAIPSDLQQHVIDPVVSIAKGGR